MENDLKNVLINVTKDHTVLKIKNLLERAKMQYKDYTNELVEAEKKDYEYEVINEVEEANADNPLHDKLDDLEEILESLIDSSNGDDIEKTLKRAYKEFSNGFCNKCVDYLNREELKEKLIKSTLEFQYDNKDTMNKIVQEWINNLIE